jgi:hypothetical protein
MCVRCAWVRVCESSSQPAASSRSTIHGCTFQTADVSWGLAGARVAVPRCESARFITPGQPCAASAGAAYQYHPSNPSSKEMTIGRAGSGAPPCQAAHH